MTPTNVEYSSRRIGARRIGALCLLLFTLVLSPGCTVWQLFRQSSFYEPRSYTLEPEECRDMELYRKWAREAWATAAFECPESLLPGHYEEGFQDGFVDYVFAGGTGEPPPIPPRRYWRMDYRNDFGDQTIESWNAGFRHGARMAIEGGYRNRAVVPARDPSNLVRPRGVFGPLPQGVLPADPVSNNTSENYFPAPNFENDEYGLPPDAPTPAEQLADEAYDTDADSSGGSATRNSLTQPSEDPPIRREPVRRQPQRIEPQRTNPSDYELDDRLMEPDSFSEPDPTQLPPPQTYQSNEYESRQDTSPGIPQAVDQNAIQPDGRDPENGDPFIGDPVDVGDTVDEIELFENSSPELNLEVPGNSDLDLPQFDDGAGLQRMAPENPNGFFGQSMVPDVPTPPLEIAPFRHARAIMRATYLENSKTAPQKSATKEPPSDGFFGSSMTGELP